MGSRWITGREIKQDLTLTSVEIRNEGCHVSYVRKTIVYNDQMKRGIKEADVAYTMYDSLRDLRR